MSGFSRLSIVSYMFAAVYMKLQLLGTVAVYMLTPAAATCYCPTVASYNPDCGLGWLVSGDGDHHCWTVHVIERAPCVDVELQGECEKAAIEIEDYIEGRYRKRERILNGLLHIDAINMTQYAATDAAVSSVIEDAKVRLGLSLECSFGLFTTTMINDRVSSWCYSPELHTACTDAQSNADAFVNGIIPALREEAARKPMISTAFVDLFEMQFTESSNTMDIHCNVTQRQTYFTAGAVCDKSDAVNAILLAMVIGASMLILW